MVNISITWRMWLERNIVCILVSISAPSAKSTVSKMEQWEKEAFFS